MKFRNDAVRKLCEIRAMIPQFFLAKEPERKDASVTYNFSNFLNRILILVYLFTYTLIPL